MLPGILIQTVLSTIAIGVNLNTDIEEGVFDRFRSLPIPRSAPLVGAMIADVRALRHRHRLAFAFGYLMGFRIGTDPLSALGGCLLAVGSPSP